MRQCLRRLATWQLAGVFERLPTPKGAAGEQRGGSRWGWCARTSRRISRRRIEAPSMSPPSSLPPNPEFGGLPRSPGGGPEGWNTMSIEATGCGADSECRNAEEKRANLHQEDPTFRQVLAVAD